MVVHALQCFLAYTIDEFLNLNFEIIRKHQADLQQGVDYMYVYNDWF